MGHLSSSLAGTDKVQSVSSTQRSGKQISRAQNHDRTSPPSTSISTWYAFYVKPRHEKKVVERLSEQIKLEEFGGAANEDDQAQPEIFCPMKEDRVKWSDRWKTVTKPYIPGYLFARVTEQQRLQILNDPSVFRTVCWKGRPAKIRDEEINIVKRVIGDPGVDDLRLEALNPGDLVEITGGELMNMNGVVVTLKGDRATILLESMHCNMTFAVDRSLLEVVG